MDGIIVLVILIFIVSFILLIIILGKVSSNQQSFDSLANKLNQLRDQLYDLGMQIKDLKNKEVIKIPEIKKEPVQPIIKRETIAEPAIIPKAEKPAVVNEKQTGKAEIPVSPAIQKEEAIPDLFSSFPGTPVADDKTDWEKFIGENLANKIGIAVLVLGISFFVKFAIDKNWINETGRVVIGLVSGGILIALAHSIRNSYRSFSSVLVGGGLTVFYFSIAFAFHQYHLLNQQAAFIIMVIITGFAVILSLYYDRIELAILAVVGGFITPFLVSTGQNNYIALFSYLCILNSGLLVLSWFKRWKAINIIALFFTITIYGSWLFRQLFDENEIFPFRWALFFATLFYALSVAINIINNLKLKIKFGAFDFILLLSINFLYYVAGMVTLRYWNHGDYQGLFTAALGVVNLLLALIFLKQKRADRNFVYLLVGLTLTFISLTGPVQLKGNYITLFWAAESVVLFWMYQRSRLILLKIASLLIVIPLLISLFMDWYQVYAGNINLLPVIVNKGFITTLATAAAFLLYYSRMRKEADTFYLQEITNKLVRNIFLLTGIILGYSAGAWEIYYQFGTRLPGTSIYAAYLQLYSFAFILFLLPSFKKSPWFIFLKFILTIAGVVLYINNLHINYIISVQMLVTGKYTGHFIAHWISAVLLTWLLYDLIAYFRKQKNKLKDYEIPFTWIAAICLVSLLSIEIYQVNMWINYRNGGDWEYWENLYYKAGLSILWGLCSFTMMWLGMKYKFKTLRVISLTLFTVTLIKLFIFDLQNIPPGGKIAAFILLGVLLLIVSFMYQRLKKLIIDDPGK
ncbi:MAG: DUF2339 domain-containing protein [Bacteroidota bacterium]|nr:DUF2339 domain-containing protein [Bacteroidota bacterium]